MKIIATLVAAKELQPGDLFSTAGQVYWNAVCQESHPYGNVGEKVYIRTCTPCPSEQEHEQIYRIEIQK